MGSFNSAKWLVILCLYFIVFISIVSTVDTTKTGIDGYIDIDTLGSLEGECQRPRSIPEIEGFLVNIPETTLRCDRTRGAIDEDICNSLEGCDWNATTKILWWGGEYTCQGELDFDYYDVEDEWDSYNQFIRTFKTQSVCDLSGVRNESEICWNLGCSWIDGEELTTELSTNVSSKGIFSTLGALFSFRYDFGFDDKYNNIVNMLLFWLPLLMLLLTIYYSLPLIH